MKSENATIPVPEYLVDAPQAAWERFEALATISAVREFIEAVSKTEGVTVRLIGRSTLNEQTIVVEVPSITSPQARSVVHLQGEMHRKYPGATIRLHVDEVNR